VFPECPKCTLICIINLMTSVMINVYEILHYMEVSFLFILPLCLNTLPIPLISELILTKFHTYTEQEK
jgi:hypothetical protein